MSRFTPSAENIGGHRIAVESVRDSATEVVMAADTVDGIEAGIVSNAEFEQLPKTGFGCRP